MPSRSSAPRGAWLMALCVLLVLTLVGVGKMQLYGQILSDPFHQGEYFASLTTLLAPSIGFDALTIHGALDFLPAWAALGWFGEGFYFFPTWLIYQGLDLLAALLFVVVVYEVIDRPWTRWPVLIISALMASSLVGYRDVLLMLSLYLYWMMQRPQGQFPRLFLAVGLGLSVAAGLFWSFDRGIAGAAALGLAALIQWRHDRRYGVALFVFGLAVGAVSRVWPAFSLSHYASNLEVLLATSGQWSLGWQRRPMGLTGLLFAVDAIAVSRLVWMTYQSRFETRTLANALLWGLLCVVTFKMGTNRADVQHILMGLWAPFLSLLYVSCVREHGSPPLPWRRYWAALAIFLTATVVRWFRLYPDDELLLLLAILSMLSLGWVGAMAGRQTQAWMTQGIVLALAIQLTLSAYAAVRGVQHGIYQWSAYLMQMPTNAAMSAPGVRWAAERLTQAGASCVFDLSNNGLIHGLTNLPSCTRFVYPVYATVRHEAELIQSLKTQSPAAIVYSTGYWSYRIDNKSMVDRFPALDHYILQTYLHETCALDYCVRYLEKKTP